LAAVQGGGAARAQDMDFDMSEVEDDEEAPAEPAADPADVAREHAQKGVALYRQDNYGDAVGHLVAAEKVLVVANLEVPALIYAAMARCYDQLGQATAAMRYYTRFLSVVDAADESLAETVRRAHQAKKRLQTLLDNTALRFEVDPDGAEVRIDRRSAGVTPLDPVKVPPGPHQVTFWARGYEPNSVDVDVAAGATVPVVVTLTRKQKPVQPTPAPQPPPPPPPPAGVSWVWWAGGGAAAVAVVATVTAVLLWPEEAPDTHGVGVTVKGR